MLTREDLLKDIILNINNYKIIPVSDLHWHSDNSKKTLNICLIKKNIKIGYDSDTISRICSCGKNITDGNHIII